MRVEHTRSVYASSVTSATGVSSVAVAGQVDGLDRVTRRLERCGDRLPAPGAAERAVDEDEAGHLGDRKHQLALCAAGLARLVRTACLLERERLRDVRA